MEKFTPAPGYILLQPYEDTQSLIVTNKAPVMRGLVVAIGDKTEDDKFHFKLKDVVVHLTLGYEVIELNGTEHRIISFKNVIGKYENKNKI